jgi:ribosomal protein S18 acetylase RimI-like enzyme
LKPSNKGRVEEAAKMDVTLRPATLDDIPDLAQLHLLAAHGLFDALYHDAIPGLPINEIIERVLAPTETMSYKSASVAVRDGKVIGEIQTFPFDHFGNAPPDPFIPKERLALYKPFEPLRPLGAGSYYINILAVYPQFQGKGIGSKLVNLARSQAVQRGFSKLSLHSFDDAPVVAFYQRLGFTVVGRSPSLSMQCCNSQATCF